MREFEHAVIEGVESGQGDELELVAHRAELALEFGDRRVVELRLPVEGGRAVVGEQLAGKLGVDRLGEFLRFSDIGLGRFAPEQVGVGRIASAARDRLVDPGADPEEAFRRALAGQEGPVALVDIAGQERGASRVRARDEHRRHIADIGGQPRGGQIRDRGPVGISTLPPIWPHFFSDAS